MNIIEKLHQWHKTTPGFLIFGLVEIVLAYLFGSLAIDSGSLWAYLATGIFGLGAAHNVISLFKEMG